MEANEIVKLLWKERLSVGRMMCSSKGTYMEQHPNNVAIFNANIVTITHGKIWYGDLDVTQEANKLKEISAVIGEPLFILREMDARFENEETSPSEMIKKAVWNTSDPIPKR